MFCPICKAEYREGYYRCESCGTDLVSLRESNATVRTDVMELWQGDNPVLFTRIQHDLTEAGIEHHAVPRYVYPKLDMGDSALERRFIVRVLEQDCPKAQEILDKLMALVEAHSPTSFVVDEQASGHEESAQEFESRLAIASVWEGGDESQGQILGDCLRENGIGYRFAGDGNAAEGILVMPRDEDRARQIVREVLEGRPAE